MQIKAVPPDRTQPGLLVLVAGLGGTLVALFGLPLQAITSSLGNGFYFGDIRRYSQPTAVARATMSPVAAAWWDYLGYLLAGLLVLLVAVTAAVPAVRRPVAQVTAALGLAAAAIYTIALIQTSHLERVFETFRRTGTSFDADRYGIWATYAGLVVLVAGAVLVAVTTPFSAAPAVTAAQPDRVDDGTTEADSTRGAEGATEPDRVAAEPDRPGGAGGATEPAGARGADEAATSDGVTERDADGAVAPAGARDTTGSAAAAGSAGPDGATKRDGADEAADQEGADPATGAR